MHVWDEELWSQIEPIYDDAFPEQGRKTKAIFQSAVNHGHGVLHAVLLGNDAVAMAFCGVSEESQALLIDYIAVARNWRGRGIGSALLDTLKDWAASLDLSGIIVEVEYNQDECAHPEAQTRIQFWLNHGFQLTEYVHDYGWVPQRYQAMYCNFLVTNPLPDDGRTLFQFISRFHKSTYQYR